MYNFDLKMEGDRWSPTEVAQLFFTGVTIGERTVGAYALSRPQTNCQTLS